MRASAWISWAAEPLGKEEIIPPIDGETLVEVMFRNEMKRICPASLLFWGEDTVGSALTIVAYRIVWEDRG